MQIDHKLIGSGKRPLAEAVIRAQESSSFENCTNSSSESNFDGQQRNLEESGSFRKKVDTRLVPRKASTVNALNSTDKQFPTIVREKKPLPQPHLK